MPSNEATTSRTSPRAETWDVPAGEWDELTTALNRWGVLHVAPVEPRRDGVPETATALFARLATSAEPRLHQAIVVLLLTHPDLAADARAAIERLVGVEQDRAKRRYMAAAALQRMARTRIALRLGQQPLIPVAYLDDLDLPPLEEEFGRVTLLALAAQESDRYGYDAWGTYRTLLDLFLSEFRRRDWGVVCESAPTATA
jgi:hypothetical protein